MVINAVPSQQRKLLLLPDCVGLLRHVKHLAIYFSDLAILLDIIPSIFKHCTGLFSLEMYGTVPVNLKEEVILWLKSLDAIKSLRINDYARDTNLTLQDILPVLTRVASASLYNLSRIPHLSAETPLFKCQNLVDLDVWEAEIDDADLSLLLQNCPQLHTLRILINLGCNLLTERGTYEAIRDHGKHLKCVILRGRIGAAEEERDSLVLHDYIQSWSIEELHVDEDKLADFFLIPLCLNSTIRRLFFIGDLTWCHRKFLDSVFSLPHTQKKKKTHNFGHVLLEVAFRNPASIPIRHLGFITNLALKSQVCLHDVRALAERAELLNKPTNEDADIDWFEVLVQHPAQYVWGLHGSHGTVSS